MSRRTTLEICTEISPRAPPFVTFNHHRLLNGFKTQTSYHLNYNCTHRLKNTATWSRRLRDSKPHPPEKTRSMADPRQQATSNNKQISPTQPQTHQQPHIKPQTLPLHPLAPILTLPQRPKPHQPNPPRTKTPSHLPRPIPRPPQSAPPPPHTPRSASPPLPPPQDRKPNTRQVPKCSRSPRPRTRSLVATLTVVLGSTPRKWAAEALCSREFSNMDRTQLRYRDLFARLESCYGVEPSGRLSGIRDKGSCVLWRKIREDG